MVSLSTQEVLRNLVFSSQVQERTIEQVAQSSLTIERLVDELAQGNDTTIVDYRTPIDHEEHQIPDIPEWAERDVSGWITGEKELEVTQENSLHYLHAAKYLDLHGQQTRPTFDLRMQCLLKNPDLTTADAFSYRLHPEFFNKKNPNGSPNYSKSLAIIAAAGSELSFVPEWQKMQKTIAQEVLATIRSLSKQLNYQEPHFLLFTGTYGSGKSYQTKNHPLMTGLKFNSDSPFSGVLNSDEIKKLYMHKNEGLSNDHVHNEGCGLRSQLQKAIAKRLPELTIIQEAVMPTSKSMESTLGEVLKNKSKVKIVFTDADFERSVLSILTRAPGEAIPAFDSIVSAQKNVRETRNALQELVAKESLIVDYELRYRDRDGSLTVVAQKENGQIVLKPGFDHIFVATDDETIKAVREMCITHEHVAVYGESLNKFIGMTVEKALEQLARM